MAYLAGAIVIAFILFGWSFNIGIVPVVWIVVALLLVADIALES